MKLTKKHLMSEMILNIIEQGYAEIKEYEDSFPVPTSDMWVYERIESIIEEIIGNESRNYYRVWVKGSYKLTSKIGSNGKPVRKWIKGKWTNKKMGFNPKQMRSFWRGV